MIKINISRTFFLIVILLMASYGHLSAQTQQPVEDEPAIIQQTESPSKKTAGTQQTDLTVLKQEEQAAKTEQEKAKKELRLQQLQADLQKKEADIKRKEAELAQKEAQLTDRTNQSENDIQQLRERARKKDQEAQIAQQKVSLAEEKIKSAQNKIDLAETKLALARQRAELAESKVTQKRLIFYRKLLQTGAIILVGYLLLFLAIRLINSHIQSIRVKHLARKNVLYFTNFFIMLSILFVWVQNLNSITIFFSIVSAGLALALQEVILSIAGWIHILTRRPFEIGDRIEFGGVKGDVIDIRLFQTSLLEIGNWVDADQSTGRIVNVPNSFVFKKENYNYSHGFEFIWNEIKVLVTFESDWKRGEQIMLEHSMKEAKEQEKIVKNKIKNMTKRYMIYYDKLTPIVYVSIQDSGVCLTLRYLTDARRRRSTQDMLCRLILDDFEKEPSVNFAYPTFRIVQQ